MSQIKYFKELTLARNIQNFPQINQEENKSSTFSKFKASQSKSWINNQNHLLSWKFSDKQKDILRQYYGVNLLLMYCLDTASDEIRAHIEDTLLLPVAEIEKRRLGD